MLVRMVRSGQYMWYIWCDQGSTCGTVGAVCQVQWVRFEKNTWYTGCSSVFQTLYVLKSLGAQAAGPSPCECNRLPTWTEMRIPFCTLHAVTFV